MPGIISNLKNGLESVDLSHNKLRGQIPQLIGLYILSYFNESYNFSGLVPDKGQFPTFAETSYRDLHLYGPTMNKSCNSAKELPAATSNRGEEDEFVIDMVSFNWSFGASYDTFILGWLFAILWISPYWRWLWFRWCIYWCICDPLKLNVLIPFGLYIISGGVVFLKLNRDICTLHNRSPLKQYKAQCEQIQIKFRGTQI